MFIDLLKSRRSFRTFLEKEVEPEKIDILIEAVLRAPSSRSLNPWEFIVVSDKEILEKLSMTKPLGSAFVKDASLAIVVCADSGKSDVWIEDSSIASIIILLTAESLGLGGCWSQIRERMHNESTTAQNYVSQVLNLPERLSVESILAIGYPKEKPAPHTKEELQYEKVHANSYCIAYGKDSC